MGQYYSPTIIYPDQSISSVYSHDYGVGLKLMEHAWIGNELVNAVYARIYNKPRKVAWIGDYSNDEYETCGEAYTRQVDHKFFKKCYKSAWGDKNRIPKSRFSDEELNLVSHDTHYKYLVNHSKKEYLDLDSYVKRCTVKGGNWDGYCVNPLPLLTACGNGRGGGDFFKGSVGYDNVGIWAFDELELADMAPEEYVEQDYNFFEK